VNVQVFKLHEILRKDTCDMLIENKSNIHELILSSFEPEICNLETQRSQMCFHFNLD